MLRYLPFLLVLALWIYAFVDCLNTPDDEVRHLPKAAWLVIVLLFGEVLVGPVAWLLTGRVRPGSAGGSAAARHGGTAARWVAPDDNPEFLRSLGERGELDKDDDPRHD
ncbi:PLD nuclease N-terminal domain-containing protein [Streptomyces sp. AGS-58]|uniref:PLD nuclease N-terminal domain-containing protein n=1 Tax=unclassified Streptomyces TaxID=2593676 RepID=UPI0035A375A2